MAKRQTSYAGALRRLRTQRGLSQRALAAAIGVSQPLIVRTEKGARQPDGPEEIDAVAGALQLGEEEHDQLLRLAGYWPSAFTALGPDDPTLGAVARALTDRMVPEAVRDELRRAIDGVLGAVRPALEVGLAPAEPARDGAAEPGPGRPRE